MLHDPLFACVQIASTEISACLGMSYFALAMFTIDGRQPHGAALFCHLASLIT